VIEPSIVRKHGLVKKRRKEKDMENAEMESNFITYSIVLLSTVELLVK
jgi:hypothetical protein